MKRVLIAVDETRGTKDMFEKVEGFCRCITPEQIILIYVEKIEGFSLMDEMLGDAEMSTLREEIDKTEVKEALDKRARAVLEYYRGRIGTSQPVKTIIRTGHPAEEILRCAEEEDVELIIIGTRGSRVGRFFIGSVSREVVNNSKVPVLLVK
jgi:nucleotide-binding universal stress UspA family protein